MTRCVVIDIETRIDAGLLRASDRRGAPAGMPRGLQRVAAGAALSFVLHTDGRCDNFVLQSADAISSNERAVVRMMQSQLVSLHKSGGTLISFNGRHDLSALRVASLRLRDFARPGATLWLQAGDGHVDLMRELGDEASLWPKLSDLATALGVFSPSLKAIGVATTPSERVKCEMDVLATAALYLHIDAERRGSSESMRASAEALLEMVEAKVPDHPHLAAFASSRMVSELVRG